MEITYKWDIPQMNAHIQADGKNNVIYKVHFIYTGFEEHEGTTYCETHVGTQSYAYVAGESFVPYNDTEAFEDVVIGWLEESLDVKAIPANIQSQITPVNEDLYFTWQTV